MLYVDWRRPQETHVWEEGWRWSFTICASYRGTAEAPLLQLNALRDSFNIFFLLIQPLIFRKFPVRIWPLMRKDPCVKLQITATALS